MFFLTRLHLVFLSVAEKRVLKYLTMIGELSSPSNSVSFCFMYFFTFKNFLKVYLYTVKFMHSVTFLKFTELCKTIIIVQF